MTEPAAKTSPLVTVLMPIYNGEEFLKEAIESILTQTYKTGRLSKNGESNSLNKVKFVLKSYIKNS